MRQLMATGVMQSRGRHRVVALVLLLAWMLSLGFPAAHLADGDAPEGFVLLFIGWLGVVMLQPAWLGNVAFWLMLPILAFSRKPWKAWMRVMAVVLVICGISACFWRDLPDDSGSNPVVAFGAGFYLWMFAIWGGAIAAFAHAAMEPE